MAPTRNAVTLLGAGFQGSRLAYMWSKLGRPVYILDKEKTQLPRAYNEFQNIRVRAPSAEARNSVHFATTDRLDTALQHSWLVVECVPESLALKRSVLQELDHMAHPETIIASNSSSYTIPEIAKGLTLRGKERILNLHPFLPPEVPAIEIMGKENTQPHIIPKLMLETKAHGFEPFHVHKISSGFIIWAAIKREALLTIDEGVATPQEIDQLFKTVTGINKGPCEQMDTIGLDTVLLIEDHYATLRPGLPPEPRKLLRQMVAEGKLGVKTESGFYEYDCGV